MKTIKMYLSIACLATFLFQGAQAQDNPAPQTYWIHEDVVKPAKVGEYEKICHELIDNAKKYDIQEINVITFNSYDNRYLYVSPIDNMAALDQSIFKSLSEKMGRENLNGLFDRMNQCYDIEHDYTIHLESELTYMPEGFTQTPEGQDYRMFHFLYVSPGNQDVVFKKMKAVRDVFASENSKLYYRVYSSGFGNRGQYYLVAIAAKDELDLATREAENRALLGDEGKNALGDLLGNILRHEKVSGTMRPDLAYAPEK